MKGTSSRQIPAVLLALAMVGVAGCGSGSTNAGVRPASPLPSTSRTAVGSSSPSASSSPSPGRPATNPKTLAQALPAIEQFVSHERGLPFKHPVTATVLPKKAFLAKLDAGDGTPTPKEVEQLIATISSLGLISPHTDIVKAFKSADDDDTLGFYDSKTKKLYVRGTAPTPGVRAVLSHELTHALTDQWFGIDRPKLDNSNQELGLAFETLTEGDAERTRKAYEAKVLTPAQRKAAEHEENSGPSPHVPLIILEIIGLPYVIGPQFVDAVVAQGGIKALNAAYRNPPKSSEQLLDPTTYFAHDNPKHVARPAADGVVVDHGDLGYLVLLLMLEHGLTRDQALDAVVGWGGDQYVTWRAGTDRWCLRDTVVMDYGLARNSLNRALDKWVATTHGRARVEQTGAKKTTFITCSS